MQQHQHQQHPTPSQSQQQQQQLLLLQTHRLSNRHHHHHHNHQELLQRVVHHRESFDSAKHKYSPKPPAVPSWANDTKILYSCLVNKTPAHRKGSVGATCARARPTNSNNTVATTTTSSTTTYHDDPQQQQQQQEPKNLSSNSGGSHNRTGNLAKVETEKALLSNNQHDQNNNNNNNQHNNNQHHHNSNASVIGHYELSRTLGKGNFSTVKLAQHRLTQHSVAIKVVKTSVLSEDNLLKINREIDVLKRLGKHNHIVRLYQVIKTKRYFMLITEYCANGELYDYLVERGKLSESQSCNYFQQILSAVEYLHDQNVVHRDLKAENLLLTNDYKTIKIADFGFANYFKRDNLLSTWCGSPPYAAPELFKGVQYVGPPVDIWSMGVILYVLVCGSLPFDGHNLVYLKSRVLSGKFRIPFFMSTECEGLVRGMLRLEPERRFSIRQIRGHSWIAKYGSPVSKDVSNNSSNNNGSLAKKHLPSAPPMDATQTQNCSNVSMATSNLGSTKDLEKNATATNRGLSLEAEEEEKVKDTLSKPASNEDASMLCLSSASGKIVPKFIQNQSNINNKAVQKTVDTDIATAVSNISLDSNNSSMSVSQSMDTKRTFSGSLRAQALGLAKVDSSGSSNCLSKENSMDDQIIEYMVDSLGVADDQKPIRESIANDRYDDLHAIYRLLKDQPHAQLEASISAKQFKIPSLPLISLSKQKCANKPSITTGFFNAPSLTGHPSTQQQHMTFNNNNSSDHGPQQEAHCNVQQPLSGNVNYSRHVAAFASNKNESEPKPINLITNKNNKSQQETPQPAYHRDMRQRKSEDQTWKMPPQLFLTPPLENRNQRGCDSAAAEDSEDNSQPETMAGKKFARRSFDSTMQQLIDSSSRAEPGSSGNQLALANGAKHGFWDSSILDTLGASSPTVGDNNPNASSSADSTNAAVGIKPQNCDGKPENPVQVLQNLAGITTNLPQIGNQELPLNYHHQNLYNQTLLLGQLNPIALSTAITQSSMLTQQPSMPIEFTPNNLMNQNYTVMNNMTLQNNINNNCAPILNLLDPNGLMSVLERRASDGNTNGHHR